LKALESSNSINNNSGWNSAYIIIENNKNEAVAFVPSYLKTNSSGEYVFDYEWANAYHRAGGQYYPKLQISIPYTPVTGSRFLIDETYNYDEILEYISSEIISICPKIEASSAHITFLTKKESQKLEKLGWLIRKDQQFHWENKSYKTFSDFLDTLSSRKRKNIKKERLKFIDSDIKIEHLTKDKINNEHWDYFYEFYIDTTTRKWGQDYLKKEFFNNIGSTMKNEILLIMAKKDNQYIAGALNFLGKNTIYGRNWGSLVDYKFLHFELCYYQAIEYAIKNKIKIVEAGAQGTHKISRGYSPVITYSAHWMKERNFHEAVKKYLDYEVLEVEKSKKILENYLPYKK
jgi:predicted N-acyltransferase